MAERTTAEATLAGSDLDMALEAYRRELTGYCYRMLGSAFEAEDAVQETMLRAWRSSTGSRAVRRCVRGSTGSRPTSAWTRSKGRERRARPMDLGPAAEPVVENSPQPRRGDVDRAGRRTPWSRRRDPADLAVARETIRLAFVAALQHLPPRQRAVLILCEVLRWQASEVAELLDTSVASVNSALQRARATLDASATEPSDAATPLDTEQQELLSRYVDAFERYDIEALTALLHEDATQSMPPFDMWLSGRDDILTWWFGPGIGCAGSRVIPTISANGSPTFGQYKPSETGSGFEPWALQVVELRDGRIEEITFFLDTERVFPLFGLPARLEA